MNSWMHRILAYFLLIHAALTIQALIIRQSILVEYSVLILIGYVFLLFILKHRGMSRELKRMNWLMVPYSLGLSMGSVTYGIYRAFLRWQVQPKSYQPEWHVPVDDPLFVGLMCASTLAAVALAVFISKYARAKPVEPVA